MRTVQKPKQDNKWNAIRQYITGHDPNFKGDS